jgi:hypothetical protein
MARSWPRNRSSRIEPVFIAAGGQTLDYAGSREVNRLLKSEWTPKPSLLLLFFAPGAGAQHRIVGVARHGIDSKDLAKNAANSLWIPLHRSDPWSYLQYWPFERRFMIDMRSRHAEVFAFMGSDSAMASEIPVEPKVLEQTSQLATEITLRWAKTQREEAQTHNAPSSAELLAQGG